MKEFLLFPLFALGVVLGIAVTLLALAVSLVVVAVHRLSFVMCRLGLHAAGRWIRRNMTTPVLVELRNFFHQMRGNFEKKSGL